MAEAADLPDSPCVRNCCLNDDDICLGCFRSLDEIRNWAGADRETRLFYLQQSATRRQAATAKLIAKPPIYSDAAAAESRKD